MSKEEGKESFTVVDKRRFSEGGETKSTGDPAAEKTASEQKVDRSQSIDSSQANKPKRAAEVPALDFPSFIVSLATQAVVMLGEMPNPETGLLSMNLDAARQTIDILAMLQEKTKGNLTAEEQGLLQEVLTSLRLAYVNKTGPGTIAKP